MSNIIESLEWRYSIKRFDPSKKIDSPTLDKLKSALSLTASSYGLQPYSVINVEKNDLRAELKEYSFGQHQITESSHLFVFCNYTAISEEFIDDYMTQVSKIRNISLEKLSESIHRLKKIVQNFSNDELKNWTEKQTYIALGNLLTVCAYEKIDTSPIEGFSNMDYNRLLNLEKRNLNACVLLAMGYRSQADNFMKKVRRPLSQLFITENI